MDLQITPDINAVKSSKNIESEDSRSERIIARIGRRLLPFMFVLYVFAYLARVNVGFAALQMKDALHFSPEIIGLGCGMFFVGYLFMQIPSNLLLIRVGARRMITIIMIVFGLLATSMMFIKNPSQFYGLRFLLGIAEGGFFPGMIIYVSYWFPKSDRAKAIAFFMTATAITGVVGGPISGFIFNLDGVGGLAGWQWIFLLEGFPAVLMGFAVWFSFTDSPEQAKWLSKDDRDWLLGRLKSEQNENPKTEKYSVSQTFTDGKVWLLGSIYFMQLVGMYGIVFWLPEIVKGFAGLSDFKASVISAIPYVIAAVGMVYVGVSSDKTGERRWHLALPSFAAFISLLAVCYLPNPVLKMVAISIATLGIWGCSGPFWALPTELLSGPSAAGGVGLINSVAAIGGFTGPYLMGYIKNTTHNFSYGFIFVAVCMLLSGILSLIVKHSPSAQVVEPEKSAAPGSVLPDRC